MIPWERYVIEEPPPQGLAGLWRRLVAWLRGQRMPEPPPYARPTEQWFDRARKSDLAGDDEEWVSWIGACAMFARARVPMPTGALTALPRRIAQDGAGRYPRSGVERVLEQAKADATEQALHDGEA